MKMFYRKLIIFALGAAVWLSCPGQIHAGVSQAALKKAAQFLLIKLGKEGGGKAVRAFEKRLAAQIQRFGPAVLRAIEKTGPKTLQVLEGSNVPQGLLRTKLISRWGQVGLDIALNKKSLSLYREVGDDVVKVLARYPSLGKELLLKYGKTGADAILKLSRRNVRRMGFLKNFFKTIGSTKTVKLLQTIKQFGDKAMNWIWKSKKSLLLGSLLASFLINPELYLSQGGKLLGGVASTAMQTTGKTLAETGTVVLSNPKNLIIIILVSLCVLSLIVWRIRCWYAQRRRMMQMPRYTEEEEEYYR